MAPIDSTNHQNMCKVIKATFTHQGKNLKMHNLYCYTRSICETWRVET